MNLLITVLNIFILASAVFSLYWQSKILVKASYNFWTLIYGAILGIWMLYTPITSFSYVIFIAGFIVLNIMSGVGGLTDSRLVINGSFFSNNVAMTTIHSVTLTPVPMPIGKEKVIGIFTNDRQQNFKLIFPEAAEDLRTFLTSHLPNSAEVEIIDISNL